MPQIDQLRDTPVAVKFLSIEPLLKDLGAIDLTGISWVIVGGESGHGARPMREDWVRNLRDRCAEVCVPFFFKQWGGARKSLAGRHLDGRTHDAMPPTSANPIASSARRAERLREFADLHLRAYSSRKRDAIDPFVAEIRE